MYVIYTVYESTNDPLKQYK